MTRRWGPVPLLLAALVLGSLPSTGRAQVLADPVLHGQARLGDGALGSGWVVLHRVSAVEQGEVDSVRVAPDGTFRVRLPAVPRPDGSEVYFASLRHHGILYFGRAVSLPIHLDSLYLIQAYDTAVAPPGGGELVVASRSLFLEEAEPGRWQVTDLLQVRNSGSRTLVAAPDGPVWTHPLPPGVTGGEVTQVDMAAAAGDVRDGGVFVTAPFPPGERLFVVRYVLPTPFTSVPVAPGTESVEVLVREPAPAMAVTGLTQAPPVELDEGGAFRRFVSAEAPTGALSIVPGPTRRDPPTRGFAVALALLLAGIAAWALRERPTPPSPRTSPPPTSRSALILEVARLDEAFAALSNPTPEERGAYEARRKELLRRLTVLG